MLDTVNVEFMVILLRDHHEKIDYSLYKRTFWCFSSVQDAAEAHFDWMKNSTIIVEVLIKGL